MRPNIGMVGAGAGRIAAALWPKHFVGAGVRRYAHCDETPKAGNRACGAEKPGNHGAQIFTEERSEDMKFS
jgi:hypothetical protein